MAPSWPNGNDVHWLRRRESLPNVLFPREATCRLDSSGSNNTRASGDRMPGTRGSPSVAHYIRPVVRRVFLERGVKFFGIWNGAVDIRKAVVDSEVFHPEALARAGHGILV